MKIPSARTRYDMEIAADLRAQGATWQTIALKLGRHLALVQRWTKQYREEWDRLYQEAEQRLTRLAGNESRAVLRELLRSKRTKVRLAAAEMLSRLRMQEKAKEPPVSPYGDLAIVVAAAEQMSDEELAEYLAKYAKEVGERVANHLTTENTECTERIQN
jgi:Homeodomain-like domain